MAATVGVRELRQHLSRYLERVKEGESLTVTERGTVVARLVPSSGADDPHRGLVERFGATRPDGRLSEVARQLLGDTPKAPPGTADAFIEETRRDRMQ